MEWQNLEWQTARFELLHSWRLLSIKLSQWYTWWSNIEKEGTRIVLAVSSSLWLMITLTPVNSTSNSLNSGCERFTPLLQAVRLLRRWKIWSFSLISSKVWVGLGNWPWCWLSIWHLMAIFSDKFCSQRNKKVQEVNQIV
jgi:hypothetical protein